MPTEKATTPQTLEQKLDLIVLHLERLDKRDKMRTVGGFFKFLISLIPILLVVGSGWYFIQHSAEIMKSIANQAASSAAEYTKNQSSGLYEQMMKQYSIPKK